MGGRTDHMSRKMELARKAFDDAVLITMTEPLTVRVEKIKGHARTPIPMPASEGGDGSAPGSGYTKDDIKNLEQWLVTQWSGGGLYEITVTDSSVSPIAMKWAPHWDPREYPEIVPPPLRSAVNGNTSAAPPQIAPPPLHPSLQVPRMSAFPNGLPMTPLPPQPQQQPQPQPGFYPSPYQQMMPPLPPQYIGTPQWNQYNAEQERRKQDDELRAERARREQQEREMLAAKHSAELEKLRAEADRVNREAAQRHEAQLAEMRSSIAALTAQLTNQPKEDPKLALMQAELAEARRREEAAKAEREQERRDRDMRDLIKAQQEATERRIADQQRQFEAMIAAIRDSGSKPDSMLQLVKDMQRENADALKEIARTSQASIDKLQAFMMNPRDMMLMARESQQGTEAATDRISRMFGGVVEMQQKVMENALAMQPQGGGVADVVREGIQTVKDTAERYIGGKASVERAQAQAQAEIATAQARAMEAQALANHPNAQVIYTAGPGAEQAQIPQGAGLNGAQEPQATVTPITESRKSRKAKKRDAEAPTGPEVKRLGKTDREWFGMAYPQVIEELRPAVARYLESCGMTPVRVTKTGAIDGSPPEDVVQVVMTALGQSVQYGVKIPALIDLLIPERYADFADVLLPDATQPYRDDVAQMLAGAVERFKELTGEKPAKADADADDDEGEDDDEPDDDKQAS